MPNPSRRILPASRTCRAGPFKTFGSLAVLALLLATGCASVGAPEQSRTLTSFEQLSVQPDGSRAWRDAQAGRYEAVRIDPSAIAFGADIRIDEGQRNELRTALTSALSERFSSAGLLPSGINQGRPTLSVRGTVTGVELASPALNVVTTLLLFAPLSRGGLTVELEAVDSESGKRVAALAFAGTAGVENLTSAYSSTGHARLQARAVAERFVQLVAGNQTARPAAP
jgi:Protein of unknown function (DUF3313)